MKKEKGITLISLIITTIVLLILAGVTLNLTLGNKGIFRISKNAVNMWETASVNEQQQLNNFENEYRDILGNKNDETDNKNDVGEVELSLELSYIGSSSFTVNANATATKGKIVKYQYKLNDRLIDETEENICTLKDLNPNSTYRLAVTAVDEEENTNTKVLEVTTKDRLYIIKDGKQQFKDATTNIRTTVVEENDYCKITFNASTARDTYVVHIDGLDDYSKIFVETSIKMTGASNETSIGMGVGKNSVDVNTGSDFDGITIWRVKNGTCSTGKGIFSHILNKEYKADYVLFQKNATTTAVGGTMYIYNLYLEK